MLVRFNKRLYGLKQASRTWHAHLTTCLKILGFEQYITYSFVLCLIEDGQVVLTADVHVNGTFAVGQKERCIKFYVDLNRTIPVNNLGELKSYGEYGSSRDCENIF